MSENIRLKGYFKVVTGCFLGVHFLMAAAINLQLFSFRSQHNVDVHIVHVAADQSMLVQEIVLTVMQGYDRNLKTFASDVDKNRTTQALIQFETNHRILTENRPVTNDRYYALPADIQKFYSNEGKGLDQASTEFIARAKKITAGSANGEDVDWLLQQSKGALASDLGEAVLLFQESVDQKEENRIKQISVVAFLLITLLGSIPLLAVRPLLRWAIRYQSELNQKSLSLNAEVGLNTEIERLASIAPVAAGLVDELETPLKEIRTKLSSIKNELTSKGEMPSKINLAICIDETIRSAAKISHVISQIMEHTKKVTALAPLEKIEAQTLIDKLKEIQGEYLNQQHIQIKTDIAPNLNLECRQQEILQVLLILTKNSAEAIANQKEAWIHLEAAHSENGVLFKITDSGEGIISANPNQLFQPFFTTKSKDHSLGFSLHTANRIVSQHNGKIWLDTSCANTRFCFHLPYKVGLRMAA